MKFRADGWKNGERDPHATYWPNQRDKRNLLKGTGCKWGYCDEPHEPYSRFCKMHAKMQETEQALANALLPKTELLRGEQRWAEEGDDGFIPGATVNPDGTLSQPDGESED